MSTMEVRLILSFHLFYLQRLLRMVDGLNFKEFVSFLSTFSARASLQQKIECNARHVSFPPFCHLS